MNEKTKKIIKGLWLVICIVIIISTYVLVHTLDSLNGVNYGFSIGFAILLIIFLIIMASIFNLPLNINEIKEIIKAFKK